MIRENLKLRQCDLTFFIVFYTIPLQLALDPGICVWFIVQVYRLAKEKRRKKNSHQVTNNGIKFFSKNNNNNNNNNNNGIKCVWLSNAMDYGWFRKFFLGLFISNKYLFDLLFQINYLKNKKKEVIINN